MTGGPIGGACSEVAVEAIIANPKARLSEGNHAVEALCDSHGAGIFGLDPAVCLLP